MDARVMVCPGVRLFFPFGRPSGAAYQIPDEEVGMDSGMIGKIQKSKFYAEEPERIRFEQFQVTFDGTNSKHEVVYERGNWRCTCNFFATRGVCSHTMAMERLLGVMLPPEAVAPAEPVAAMA
jgi:hypothetical protein